MSDTMIWVFGTALLLLLLITLATRVWSRPLPPDVQGDWARQMFGIEYDGGKLTPEVAALRTEVALVKEEVAVVKAQIDEVLRILQSVE